MPQTLLGECKKYPLLMPICLIVLTAGNLVRPLLFFYQVADIVTWHKIPSPDWHYISFVGSSKFLRRKLSFRQFRSFLKWPFLAGYLQTDVGQLSTIICTSHLFNFFFEKYHPHLLYDVGSILLVYSFVFLRKCHF